ncbi:SH3 domain-containing protein [Bosea sp. RAF48]|uniref:SH3 domain-containing protein n=1 Tax=Bosea sp. RAF48 TaxID=3237480 RepID=UPI003F918FB3
MQTAPPAQPLTASRSLFAEPTTNGYRGEPAARARLIKRSLYVRGKDVPMRAEPHAKAKILNRMPNGMEVGELSRREGWVEIRHPISAIEGWVSARRLSEMPRQTDEAKTEEQPKPKRKETPGLEVLSDAAIIAKLIALDASAYSGNCRCPENRDRAGRLCGKRSAYSKPGGWAPLCYPGDVSREAIARFRSEGGR